MGGATYANADIGKVVYMKKIKGLFSSCRDYVTDKWWYKEYLKAIGAAVGVGAGCIAVILTIGALLGFVGGTLFNLIGRGIAIFVDTVLPNLVIFVGIPVTLILAFRKTRTVADPECPAPGTMDIELARARANGILPLMKQTAFLLFCELSHYLPGVTKPFSLSAVEAPTPYTITVSMVTIYHTIIVKGGDETPVSVVLEIMESLISQHLRAKNLPLAVPATYTNEAGETYPGLVCDGIYDAGTFWRVDFVICNEAETVRLKARAIEKLEGLSGAGALYDNEL